MTKAGAERAVVISALVVFIVYFYRHFTEGTDTNSSGGLGQLLGIGTPASIGKFVTAWGFVFFILAIVADAAPGLGGSFAILAATGDVLANTTQVAKDVQIKLSSSSSPSITSTKAPASSGNTTVPFNPGLVSPIPNTTPGAYGGLFSNIPNASAAPSGGVFTKI